ncbi:uncharacterized protein LOC128211422 [Mya arenaria]|uniref:uncharacterized protein LOC128211422 n=1 Tax=Mya arenaria TaxID=6604 RepID=UPI0022E4FD76|nr:uncharacterized protein LOC128211422 [Mya arenaria]
MAVLKNIFFLILNIVGLVRSYEPCGESLSCVVGYCCADNTKCCYTEWSVGLFVMLGFSIVIFLCVIAAVACFYRRRSYTVAPFHQCAPVQTGYIPPAPTGQARFVNPMVEQIYYSPH